MECIPRISLGTCIHGELLAGKAFQMPAGQNLINKTGGLAKLTRYSARAGRLLFFSIIRAKKLARKLLAPAKVKGMKKPIRCL